jgi:hypothetical protein
MGDYCENLLNKTNGNREPGGFCSANPCLNDGVCIEVGTFNGYCRCSAEYRGVHCESPVRALSCSPNPW